MIDFDGIVPLEDKRNLPRKPGIYFILDAGKNPLYVGKSIDIYHRWIGASHNKYDYAKQIPDASIGWVLVPKNELDAVEYDFIQSINPEINCQVNDRMSKKTSTSFYIESWQKEALKQISTARIPMAEHMRRAISQYLENYRS